MAIIKRNRVLRPSCRDVKSTYKVDTKNVVRFSIDIAGLVDICENTEVKTELEKLNELFKFSDPVTSGETKESEEAIKSMVLELKALVAEGSTNDTKTLIKRIANALNERNRICKASK